MHILLTILYYAYLVSYSFQINFPGGVGVGVAGLIEIKANSASQQSLSWGLAWLSLAKIKILLTTTISKQDYIQ